MKKKKHYFYKKLEVHRYVRASWILDRVQKRLSILHYNSSTLYVGSLNRRNVKSTFFKKMRRDLSTTDE